MIEVEDFTNQRLQPHIRRACVLISQAETVGSVINLHVDDFTYRIRVFEDATVAADFGQRLATPAFFSESDSNTRSDSEEEGEWRPGSNSDEGEFVTDSLDSVHPNSERVRLASPATEPLGSGIKTTQLTFLLVTCLSKAQ